MTQAQPFSEDDQRKFLLSRRDFDRLAAFIHDYSGIRMPVTKKAMVEGRLRRRIRALGFNDVHAYCNFVFDEDGLSQEGPAIVDAVTTNKTDFFREPEHFRYLKDVAFPKLALEDRIGFSDPLQIWSAASSIGAEAYSLAMLASDFAEEYAGFRYSVLATDICSEVLEQGATAVYSEDLISPIPPAMRRRYLMRSIDRSKREVRIVPELRRNVRFARVNLTASHYPVPRKMHVAFCRNVLIYFERPMQAAVLSHICDCLLPGGYLFIGHSETVAGYSLPVRQVAPTIFQRV